MSEETIYLGEYDKLAPLGKGGQSRVYKVRHAKFGCVRAVAILCSSDNKPIYIKDSDDIEWKKFEERCGRLLRLCNGNHPNIVHCYHPKLYDHQAFFEMDYIEGNDLSQFMEKNNYFLSIDEVLNMVIQISDALSFCHYGTWEYNLNPFKDKLVADENDGNKLAPINDEERKRIIKDHKVIHNDISSKNIMRCSDGRFILIDFGLSVEGEEQIGSQSIRHEGHPEYKAPEKWNGLEPTTKSDIYSFGIVI